jgi:hypothetical protein
MWLDAIVPVANNQLPRQLESTIAVIITTCVSGSVADPDYFDADPDPTYEKNRIRSCSI